MEIPNLEMDDDWGYPYDLGNPPTLPTSFTNAPNDPRRCEALHRHRRAVDVPHQLHREHFGAAVRPVAEAPVVQHPRLLHGDGEELGKDAGRWATKTEIRRLRNCGPVERWSTSHD